MKIGTQVENEIKYLNQKKLEMNINLTRLITMRSKPDYIEFVLL